MTRMHTISKRRLLLLVTGLVALALAAFAANPADAAPLSGAVTATCYSDGYIIVNDGGNVASAPMHLQLRIAHRNAQGGWSWTTYKWRSISGSSFRLNATKGAQYYIWARVATATGNGGFTYAGNWVSVTNVKISPIGAVASTSRNARGFCQT